MNWPVVGFLNFNRADLALRMLKQLRGCHVVALDNGGNPPLIARLNALPEYVARGQVARHIAHGERYIHDPGFNFSGEWYFLRENANLYYGGGANALVAGIALIFPKTEVVWVMNDDVTEASPEMAYALYEYLKANPKVGMVSPAVDGTTHHSTQNRGTGGPRDVKFIDFTCPMVRLTMWQQLGGINYPRYIGFGTDVDMCARAIKAGWRLVVHDGWTIQHPSPADTCVSEGTFGLHSDPVWVGRIQEDHGKPWHVLTTQGP